MRNAGDAVPLPAGFLANYWLQYPENIKGRRLALADCQMPELRELSQTFRYYATRSILSRLFGGLLKRRDRMERVMTFISAIGH